MLDSGQIKVLNDPVTAGEIDNNKFRLMEGRRLCSAIDLWLRAHMQANEINKFPAVDAQAYRTTVCDIAQAIDAMNRYSPPFETAVGALAPETR
jgi:hypothetical protein